MNIKIKKKILVCMLWLCAIACFTGFPWIFFSWDVIHSYMGIHDIPSDLTIVLFREECLFFGFFCIYFLFLRNIEKYKGLISFCSFLVAFMGGFMYLLKLQTGIVHISSDYEPFIWLIIGSFIFYLNHSINGIAPKKQKGSSDISSDSFLKRQTAQQIVYLNCDQQMYSYEQQFSISCLGSLYPQMHS